MKSSVTLLAVAALAACNGENPGDGVDKGGTGDTDTTPPPAGVETIWINEVMAQNTSTFPDEGGSYPDWVELWNPNDDGVDLSGWWLSDDRDDPFNWQFPDGVSISAGEHLVLFLDKNEIEGDLHVGFKLDGLGGEDVALFGPNLLGNPLVDALEDMSVQLPDQSMARQPDGGPTWSQDATPTPAAPNN